MSIRSENLGETREAVDRSGDDLSPALELREDMDNDAEIPEGQAEEDSTSVQMVDRGMSPINTSVEDQSSENNSVPSRSDTSIPETLDYSSKESEEQESSGKESGPRSKHRGDISPPHDKESSNSNKQRSKSRTRGRDHNNPKTRRCERNASFDSESGRSRYRSKRSKRRKKPSERRRLSTHSSSETSSDNSTGLDSRDSDRQFKGDVSEWGRIDVPLGFGENSSKTSLSSGLSPRCMRPAKREWVPEEAQRSLAYNSSVYASLCNANSRWVGDDLPTRVAYQHLRALAGMAGKVQDVILHNKLVFEKRIVKQEMLLKRRAYASWRQYQQQRKIKSLLLEKCTKRVERGLLLRSFGSWFGLLLDRDRTSCRLKKAKEVQRRRKLERCLKAWRFVCIERSWKTRLQSREREVLQLLNKRRAEMNCRVTRFKRERLRKSLWNWAEIATNIRRKKDKNRRADSNFRESSKKRLIRKAERKRAILIMKSCFEMLRGNIANRKRKRERNALAKNIYMESTKRRSFRAWLLEHQRLQKKINISDLWKNRLKDEAFNVLRDRNRYKRVNKQMLKNANTKMSHRRLVRSFRSWTNFVTEQKQNKLASRLDQVSSDLEHLKAENSRLRRENERFVRLIDSGQWGRERVEEMQKAGEVMRSERDALQDLLSTLRHEYDLVQEAKARQEQEIRQLKDRIVTGGRSPASRNKMLVKGASSFNSIVRALKQDLIDQKSAVRDPQLHLEISKMAMDRVHVFPDGELKIEAVRGD